MAAEFPALLVSQTDTTEPLQYYSWDTVPTLENNRPPLKLLQCCVEYLTGKNISRSNSKDAKLKIENTGKLENDSFSNSYSNDVESGEQAVGNVFPDDQSDATRASAPEKSAFPNVLIEQNWYNDFYVMTQIQMVAKADPSVFFHLETIAALCDALCTKTKDLRSSIAKVASVTIEIIAVAFSNYTANLHEVNNNNSLNTVNKALVTEEDSELFATILQQNEIDYSLMQHFTRGSNSKTQDDADKVFKSTAAISKLDSHEMASLPQSNGEDLKPLHTAVQSFDEIYSVVGEMEHSEQNSFSTKRDKSASEEHTCEAAGNYSCFKESQVMKEFAGTKGCKWEESKDEFTVEMSLSNIPVELVNAAATLSLSEGEDSKLTINNKFGITTDSVECVGYNIETFYEPCSSTSTVLVESVTTRCSSDSRWEADDRQSIAELCSPPSLIEFVKAVFIIKCLPNCICRATGDKKFVANSAFNAANALVKPSLEPSVVFPVLLHLSKEKHSKIRSQTAQLLLVFISELPTLPENITAGNLAMIFSPLLCDRLPRTRDAAKKALLYITERLIDAPTLLKGASIELGENAGALQEISRVLQKCRA